MQLAQLAGEFKSDPFGCPRVDCQDAVRGLLPGEVAQQGRRGQATPIFPKTPKRRPAIGMSPSPPLASCTWRDNVCEHEDIPPDEPAQRVKGLERQTRGLIELQDWGVFV